MLQCEFSPPCGHGCGFWSAGKGLLARGPYPRLVATKRLEAPNFVWPTARGQAPSFAAGAKARLDFSGPCSNPNGGQTEGSTLPPAKFACASSTRTLLPRVWVTKCRLLLPSLKRGLGTERVPLATAWFLRLDVPEIRWRDGGWEMQKLAGKMPSETSFGDFSLSGSNLQTSGLLRGS